MFRALLAAGLVSLFAAMAIAQAPQALTVTSPTLKAGETIPRDYTADGKNVSPPLQWSGAPASTKEFAVICDDPDVPMPQPFVHWVIYKIPGDREGPAGEHPDRSRRRRCRPRWRAPSRAPRASVVPSIEARRRLQASHTTTTSRCYAIDAVLDLKPGLTKAELLEAIKGHVVGEGELVAIYERKPSAEQP